MTRRARRRAIVLLALAGPCMPAMGQELTFQQRNDSEPVAMTAEQLASLNDPLFKLVIRDHPKVVGLEQIEALLQPDAGQRRTFVVSERIHEPGGPQGARSVLAFDGRAADGTDLGGRVFLSVLFSPQVPRFPNIDPVEAMAWDATAGVYNYYKLDRDHGGEGFSWRFRGSSRDADQLTPEQRAGTCFACHINGAPVMKELLLPWNNWHAFTNVIQGLTSAVAAERWPVAALGSGDPHLQEGRLDGAEQLELTVIAAIERFNRARLRTAKSEPDAEGRVQVVDARRLLRPLFETTEVNLISARQTSGLHPLGSPSPGAPGVPVCPPDSFFVNANLFGGMRQAIKGLGIAEARSFQQSPGSNACAPDRPLSIASAEYRELVVRANQSLDDQAPGDAAFAWFVPEPSFVDNDMVDLLLAEGAITPAFAAAAQAVDVRTPIFSAARAGLQDFLPASFAYLPLNGADPLTASRHPDALTTEVITRLEAASLPPDSPAADFLRLLRMADPVAELRRRVVAYRDELTAKLDGAQVGAQARLTELERLHRLARTQREQVQQQAPFDNLVESPVLFPR